MEGKEEIQGTEDVKEMSMFFWNITTDKCRDMSSTETRRKITLEVKAFQRILYRITVQYTNAKLFDPSSINARDGAGRGCGGKCNVDARN